VRPWGQVWHGDDVLFILISMLVILAVAGLVVAFVAFPHRGEDIPGAAWLGDGMAKAAEAMPTIDPEAEESRADQPQPARHVGGDPGSDVESDARPDAESDPGR
jgi:hypothetical protein